MADIEMDVDINRPLGGDVQAHDEIDFDMDMADDTSVVESMDRDMQEVEGVTNDEAHTSNGMMSEDVDIEVDVVDARSDVGHDNDEMVEVFAIDTQQADELGASEAYPQENQENEETAKAWDAAGGNEPQSVEDDQASTHEIDYEVEDPEPQENSSEYKGADNTEKLESPSIERTVEAAGNDGTTQPEGDTTTENPENGIIADSTNDVEQEEAHYSGEVDHEQHETTVEDDPTVQLDHAESSFVDAGQEQAQPDENEIEEGETHAESVSNEFRDETLDSIDLEDPAEPLVQIDDGHEQQANAEISNDGGEEHDEGFELITAEDVDGSVAEQQSLDESEHGFPAITVQYKGDEYPFFSTTSNGFFGETSILDETMDKILSGLRDELANELANEDELVFQVDEMGLEFTESTRTEITSSITLRQVLEIHDLLVKNQDPDSTRTLYTYLFVKPNASKRLESLIESATQGKGLDEVIHLFESTVPAGPSLLETNGVVDEVDEQLDGYDSHTDEAEQSHEREEEHSEHHAGDDELENDAAPPTERQDLSENAEDDVTEHEVDSSAHQDALDDAEVNDEAHLVAEDGKGEANDYVDNETNSFTNLELGETDEVNNEANVADEEVDGNHTATVEDSADVETAHTDTTNTLLDEDDADSINVDIGANADTNADADEKRNEEAEAVTTHVEQDELAEIDWRDEIEAPEVDAEATATSLTAGKRARTDDDKGDVGDEQDIKRRRP